MPGIEVVTGCVKTTVALAADPRTQGLLGTIDALAATVVQAVAIGTVNGLGHAAVPPPMTLGRMHCGAVG
jgi:hypothetical protein